MRPSFLPDPAAAIMQKIASQPKNLAFARPQTYNAGGVSHGERISAISDDPMG
jgi:hypothetical protein